MIRSGGKLPTFTFSIAAASARAYLPILAALNLVQRVTESRSRQSFHKTMIRIQFCFYQELLQQMLMRDIGITFSIVDITVGGNSMTMQGAATNGRMSFEGARWTNKYYCTIEPGASSHPHRSLLSALLSRASTPCIVWRELVLFVQKSTRK